MLQALSRYAGRPLAIDATVFESERQTGHRNRAIAHLMRHFDVIGGALDETLDLYFQQCSVALTVNDLAMMAATLANDGKRPGSNERVLDSAHVRDVLSLMFTCGMYDSAGEWAYAVGLPAKSGVSGGLMVVVPGRMGLATYSPLLDARGHSVRGFGFFRDLSAELKLSMFATTV
jgi:glutaminase